MPGKSLVSSRLVQMINAHLSLPKLLGLTCLGISLQTSRTCLWILCLIWHITLHPKFCPKKSELVHGFTFSRSLSERCWTHLSHFCLVPETDREDQNQVTAFQGLEDTLACLDATYLNLEQKLLHLWLSHVNVQIQFRSTKQNFLDFFLKCWNFFLIFFGFLPENLQIPEQFQPRSWGLEGPQTSSL